MLKPDTITESAAIYAPIDRVFALSTRVELVKETLGMNLVEDPSPGYIASGHIAPHSRVHWHGWKFGLPTHHHTLITGFTNPLCEEDGTLAAWFQDSQARGRFAFFQHDHHFRQTLDPTTRQPLTTLHDEVRFMLPFGLPGRIAARFILAPHIRKLCRQRFARLNALATSDAWREFVDPTVQVNAFMAHPDPATIVHYAEAVRDGKLALPIDRILTLSEAADGQSAAEKGGIGKVVLAT